AGADGDAAMAWLDAYVGTEETTDEARTQPLPVDAFSYPLPLARRQVTADRERLDAYPGLGGADPLERVELAIHPASKEIQVLNPPGGEPASMTTVPGLGGALGSVSTYALAALPGSSGEFDTAAVPEALTVVGSPRLHLTIRSSGEEQVLFASLWQLQGSTPLQQRALVAPVRLSAPPGEAQQVTVELPAATYRMEAGSRWRILITTTDSSFSGPREVRLDQVSLTQALLELPVAQGVPVGVNDGRDTESWLVAAALLALLLGVGG